MTKGRTPRPIEVLKAAYSLMALIDRRADKPCPTHEEIMEVTGVTQRVAWEFVEVLASHGLVEVEEDGVHPGKSRRLRTFCGQWTDWTKRK